MSLQWWNPKGKRKNKKKGNSNMSEIVRVYGAVETMFPEDAIEKFRASEHVLGRVYKIPAIEGDERGVEGDFKAGGVVMKLTCKRVSEGISTWTRDELLYFEAKQPLLREKDVKVELSKRSNPASDLSLEIQSERSKLNNPRQAALVKEVEVVMDSLNINYMPSCNQFKEANKLYVYQRITKLFGTPTKMAEIMNIPNKPGKSLPERKPETMKPESTKPNVTNVEKQDDGSVKITVQVKETEKFTARSTPPETITLPVQSETEMEAKVKSAVTEAVNNVVSSQPKAPTPIAVPIEYIDALMLTTRTAITKKRAYLKEVTEAIDQQIEELLRAEISLISLLKSDTNTFSITPSNSSVFVKNAPQEE